MKWCQDMELPSHEMVRSEAEHHVRDIMRNHDATGSGYLNQQQMAKVMHDLGLDNGEYSDHPYQLEQSIQHLFELADKDPGWPSLLPRICQLPQPIHRHSGRAEEDPLSQQFDQGDQWETFSIVRSRLLQSSENR